MKLLEECLEIGKRYYHSKSINILWHFNVAHEEDNVDHTAPDDKSYAGIIYKYSNLGCQVKG